MVRLDALGGADPLVLGLSWDAISGAGDELPLKEQIENMAPRVAPGAQWGVVVESGTRTYVGFVPLPQKGQKVPPKAFGAISGAALLAAATAATQKKVLCIQRLEDGKYWLCAAGPSHLDVRTDVVLNEEGAIELADKILGDDGEDDFHSVLGYGLRELLASGRGYLRQLADRDRQGAATPGYERRLLEGRFGEDTVEIQRSPALRVKKLLGVSTAVAVAVIVAVVLVGAGIAAYFIYQKMLEQQAAEEAAALVAQQTAQQQQQAELKASRMALAIIEAVKAETQTIPPGPYVKACWALAERIGTTLGGWGLELVRCERPAPGSSASARITVKLSGVGPGAVGTSETLVAAAQALGGQVSFGSEAQAAVTVPLRGLSPRPGLTVVSALPMSQVVLRTYGTTWQVTRAASPQFASSTSPPVPYPILYVDPEKEGRTPPGNFSEVPADQGFSTMDVQWGGKARWMLPGEAFGVDDPSLTIQQVEVRPEGQGMLAFLVRGRFAVKR